MSNSTPQVPTGSGRNPILFVAISASQLAASAAFYGQVFGWRTHGVTSDMTAAQVPAGPNVALRGGTAEGFPGIVPYIGVDDVDAALADAVAAGGRVERGRFVIPSGGILARFFDPSGTLWGLMDPATPADPPPMPVPFGNNPKPPAGAICSLEMYAADGAAAARYFGGQFGWGCAETMPQYTMFDPGAGIGGVFQSHTPTLPALAYIWVNDVAVTLAAIDAAGGRRTAEPMSAPGMATFGYFQDPSGTHMGLLGP